MDTQVEATQIRMQNWIAIIKDQRASGLNINDYKQEQFNTIYREAGSLQ